MHNLHARGGSTTRPPLYLNVMMHAPSGGQESSNMDAKHTFWNEGGLVVQGAAQPSGCADNDNLWPDQQKCSTKGGQWATNCGPARHN